MPGPPPGRRCACSGRARRPVCPGSGPVHPGLHAGVLASGTAGWKRWPAPRPAASRPAVRQAAQTVLDGVGREALLDVAADAGTRVLALGQLAPAVAFGLHRWRGSWTSGSGNRNLRPAILRSRRWLGGIDPRPGGRCAAAGLACFSLRLPGMGAKGLAAPDVGPADAAAPGLASASAVVVTGPAELPFSQADQGSCQ